MGRGQGVKMFVPEGGDLGLCALCQDQLTYYVCPTYIVGQFLRFLSVALALLELDV